MITRKIASVDRSVFAQLGEAWLKEGRIDPAVLDRILSGSEDRTLQFDQLLASGALTEAELLRDLAAAMACPFWTLTDLQANLSLDLSLATRFDAERLLELGMVPISLKDESLQLALCRWPSPAIFAAAQQTIPAQSVVFGFAERATLQALLKLASAHQTTAQMAASGSSPAHPATPSSVHLLELDDWDDWDDWDEPEPPNQAQPAASTPSAPDVDALLASYLTPDDDLPAAQEHTLSSSQLASAHPSSDSFARAVTSVPVPQQNTGSHAERQAFASRELPEAQPAPRGVSSPTHPAARSQSGVLSKPTGLEALQKLNSSDNLHSASSLPASAPKPDGSASANAPSLLAADLQDVKENASRRTIKSKKKAAEKHAHLVAFFFSILRLLALVGIAYLLYQAYQNGI